MFDPDVIIKELKVQGSMGVPWSQSPRCEECGAFLIQHKPDKQDIAQGEDESYDQFCSRCLGRRMTSVAKREDQPAPKKMKPLCRYCWKSRPLVGMWCRTCRNNNQRKAIKTALKKLKTGESLSWEDEQTLAAAHYWAIWNKEFRKVKIK